MNPINQRRSRGDDPGSGLEGIYRAVFETSNVGKSITLPGGEVSFNQAFCDMLGYTADDLKGKKWQELTHPDDIDLTLRHIGALKKGKKDSARFEKKYIHRDGSVIHADINIVIVRDREKKPLYFITTAVDITDRKKTENELKEREEELKAIYEKAPVIMMVVDNERRVQKINGYAVSYAGKSYEEIIGLRGGEALGCLYSLESPEGCGYGPHCSECIVRNTVLDTLGTGNEHTREPAELLFLIDGEEKKRHFFVSTAKLQIHSRDRVLVTLEDVTELKQAEEKIAESEETYRNLFHNAQVGLFRTRITDGKILEANGQIARMFGYDGRESFVSEYKTEGNYADPGTREKMLEQIRRDGYVQNFNARFLKRDKTVFWASYSAKIYPEKGWIEGVVEDITVRKEAEEALIHSRELMKYIIENSNSAIAVHDRDLNYMYVSQRYLREYNVKEKDIIGRNHYEIFPDLPRKWKDVHQKVLAGEVHSSKKDIYIREDGTEEWTRWECRPWYESDGEIGGLIVYTAVITDEVKKNNTLLESENKYRRIAENISDVVWISDLNLELTWVSPSIRKMTGDSPDTHIQRKAEERIPPESLKMVREIFLAEMEIEKDPAADRERSRLIEMKHYRADGSVFDIAVNVSFLRDKEGRPSGILGVSRDISRQKQADRELRASEERRNTYFENAPYGIFITDREGNYLEVNPAAARITGFSRDKLLAMNIRDLLLPESGESGLKHFEEVSRTGSAYGEILFMTGQGEKRFWSVAGRKISDDLLLAFCEDITEKKRAAEEIVRLKEGLEEEVKNKTAELREKIQQLERFFDATVDRELRMGELKLEIEVLRKELEKYKKKGPE